MGMLEGILRVQQLHDAKQSGLRHEARQEVAMQRQEAFERERLNLAQQAQARADAIEARRVEQETQRLGMAQSDLAMRQKDFQEKEAEREALNKARSLPAAWKRLIYQETYENGLDPKELESINKTIVNPDAKITGYVRDENTGNLTLTFENKQPFQLDSRVLKYAGDEFKYQKDMALKLSKEEARGRNANARAAMDGIKLQYKTYADILRPLEPSLRKELETDAKYMSLQSKPEEQRKYYNAKLAEVKEAHADDYKELARLMQLINHYSGIINAQEVAGKENTEGDIDSGPGVVSSGFGAEEAPREKPAPEKTGQAIPTGKEKKEPAPTTSAISTDMYGQLVRDTSSGQVYIDAYDTQGKYIGERPIKTTAFNELRKLNPNAMRSGIPWEEVVDPRTGNKQLVSPLKLKLPKSLTERPDDTRGWLRKAVDVVTHENRKIKEPLFNPITKKRQEQVYLSNRINPFPRDVQVTDYYNRRGELLDTGNIKAIDTRGGVENLEVDPLTRRVVEKGINYGD